MSTALVVRTQRHKKIGDSSSPMVYTLKRKPQDAKIFDLARIAKDIEALGAMSSEDVEHVGKAIVRQMRQTLTDGNSVRLTVSESSTPPSSAVPPNWPKTAP